MYKCLHLCALACGHAFTSADPQERTQRTEMMLPDLWRNPSQIRKLHSFIIAGSDTQQ